MSTITSALRALDNDELPASVQAVGAWPEVGKRYQFLSTLDVVNTLREQGLRPYQARESRTRIEGKAPYTKHMLRFRHVDAIPMKGGVYPEIVLTNSHSSSSSFKVDLGLFRLVCMNGLVVSYGRAYEYRVRHVGNALDNVVEAISSAMLELPNLSENVALMQATELSPLMRISFAEQAMGLRWEQGQEPFLGASLLRTRRFEDTGSDLWSIYNVVQENLIRGLSKWQARPTVMGERHGSRQVGSIDTDMHVNKGLWELAQAFTVNTQALEPGVLV